LPDGDFVDLDHADEDSARVDDRPLVVVLHGLEGSSRSGYAMECYRALLARGVAAVGLNFRSCSGEPNRLARFYHSGDTADLRFVLGLLRRRRPERPLGAIGVSIGGNVLLKYLGEEEAESCVTVAAAVSVPFDLSAGADHLTRPLATLYAARLLRSLRAKVVAKRPLLPPTVDLPAAIAARTFRAFDDAVTAPLHGFAGVDDYYGRCSSDRFLHRIRVPTLLVHSRDDPFLPEQRIPWNAAAENPYLTGVWTERGGHVGFVSGRRPWRPRFWAEQRAAAFVAAGLRPGTAPAAGAAERQRR
jgi:predicted alpha/beta-fold hydrolase